MIAMRLPFLAALVMLAPLAYAQTNAPEVMPPAPKSKAAVEPKLNKAQLTAAELQKTVDTLTQSNHDLLDLLQKQQAVLEDIQYDRRLQSRQIQALEERLETTLYQNNQLQNKVNKLETQGTAPVVSGTLAPSTAPATPATPGEAVTIATEPKIAPAPPSDPNVAPARPASFLPAPPPGDGPPDVASWHRLFTLKGDDLKQTDLFQIRGKVWRVQWYNADKPGAAYKNTSALFINAYPKDDTIPQKVCSKLGTGGDETDLQGPGNYYLKVEASGGSWELAVEDFR